MFFRQQVERAKKKNFDGIRNLLKNIVEGEKLLLSVTKKTQMHAGSWDTTIAKKGLGDSLNFPGAMLKTCLRQQKTDCFAFFFCLKHDTSKRLM